jgi:hypothetical protein
MVVMRLQTAEGYETDRRAARKKKFIQKVEVCLATSGNPDWWSNVA